MLKEERKAYVLRMLERKHIVSVTELCEVFQISSVSVRKMLTEMEKKDGDVRRIWGGVIAADSLSAFDDKPEKVAPPQRVPEAEAIAREAYAQIHDGDIIFLDGGSPILTHLASMLIHGNKRRVTVGTNVAAVAFELLHAKGMRIILIGGEVSYKHQCCLGRQARQMIEELSFDKCFLSVHHFSIERGFSIENVPEAEVKRAVLASSRVCFFVADYSAFGKNALSLIASCEPGKRLITDARMPEEVKARLESMGMQVILAPLKE